MAQFVFNIDDAIVNRVQNKFARRHGYDPAKDGTKAEFLKFMVRRFIKRSVAEQEHKEAGDAAAAAAEAAAESEIVIT